MPRTRTRKRRTASKYRITDYTRRRARTLGVTVKPSRRHGKKLDVFRNGHLVASVGALGYGDYPTFMRSRGAAYARSRRKAYKTRHAKDRSRKNTPGYYADKLLW
jgi:hypothetical protein